LSLYRLRALSDETIDLNADEQKAYNLRIAPIAGEGNLLKIG